MREGEGAVVSGRSIRPRNTTADRRKIPSWIGSEKRNFLSDNTDGVSHGDLHRMTLALRHRGPDIQGIFKGEGVGTPFVLVE
jgi:hypothetical protein